MPDRLKTNAAGSSAGYRWIRTTIVVAVIVLLFVLVTCFCPYWREESIRQGRVEDTHRQMAEVKAGKTTSLLEPAPEMIVEIIKDRECAERITAITIGERSRISDNRFQDLKSLPHLKAVHVEYVRYGGDADAFLANIKGMTTIEELSFYHSGLTADGIRQLAEFPRLKRLTIDRVDGELAKEIRILKKALPTCEIQLGDQAGG